METAQITRLVEKYGDMLLKISYTYLKSRADAEDAVQEIFMRVIEKSPQWTDENHCRNWLIRSAVNVCKNKLKSFWQRSKRSIDTVCEMPFYDEYDTNSEVLKAVMSLPEKERIAVYMYYYEGYKSAEIAHITGKTDTAVRTYLMRARKKLKEMLKEDYDFE